MLVAVYASPLLAQAQTTGLTTSQINAIISLLQAFGADQSVIDNVRISLSGGTPSIVGQSFCYNFSSDLSVGNYGNDVSALNRALSLSGIDTTGDTASFTENTAGDVVAFQGKYGIRQTGYVGPVTRAKLNALYNTCNASPRQIIPITPSGPDFSFQLLPLKTDNNGPAFSGPIYNVCWTSGKDNANELLSFAVGSLTAQRGDGAIFLGKAYLSQGCFAFTIPRSLPSGTYIISANNTSGSLYSNSPAFAVEDVFKPTVIFSADATTIAYNTATNIRWFSTGATSCTLRYSAGIFTYPAMDNTPTSSNTGNLTAPETYTLYCSGPDGTSDVQSVTVNPLTLTGTAAGVAPTM